MTTANESSHPEARRSWVTYAFILVEDVVYIGLGVLLAACALTLLVAGAVSFVESVGSGSFFGNIVALLDRILLILLIVELLYTVQVSFREHTLVPEPFLLVALISAIRRVLVLTAEFGEWRDKSSMDFQYFIIELGVLGALVLALAISLVLVRKSGGVAATRG